MTMTKRYCPGSTEETKCLQMIDRFLLAISAYSRVDMVEGLLNAAVTYV